MKWLRRTSDKGQTVFYDSNVMFPLSCVRAQVRSSPETDKQLAWQSAEEISAHGEKHEFELHSTF